MVKVSIPMSGVLQRSWRTKRSGSKWGSEGHQEKDEAQK